MRILIVSLKPRLSDYVEFVEALNCLGAEAMCVHDLKHCFLGQSKPLSLVPIPKLLRLIKRFNPDFVLTDSPYYITHMVKLVNRRVLFHMRGGEDVRLAERDLDIGSYPSFFARIYTHYLGKIIVPSIKKTDLILPNSKWLQKQLKQYLPNHQTRVLHVGIDARKWIPNHNLTFSVEHPMVVGVFPFTVYTKVSGLLKFTRVIRKMPDVNFYFAGDGPYLDLITKNRPSNMFLLGRVSTSEVKKLLESGDIFVHPSGLDALPRSVKEASLMERPIIASDVGGIPEIVKDNETGYLCKIDDVDQWIGKIRFLLDNQDVARKFGKNAREFVIETFNWRKITKNFLDDLKAFRE